MIVFASVYGQVSGWSTIGASAFGVSTPVRTEGTNPTISIYRLGTEPVFVYQCENCGFDERRITDQKMPLLISFKDGNEKKDGKPKVKRVPILNRVNMTISSLI